MLVAAAFIGPGTVTLCSLAGFQFGFALLWALLFSVLATIVLQEMSARVGLITQAGLGDTIRTEIPNKQIRILVGGLVLAAILIGNAAYEAGNLSGAILGLETVLPPIKWNFGSLSINFWSVLIGIFAGGILWLGSYQKLEKILVALVMIMSLLFLTTAILIQPNFTEIIKGFKPTIPDGSVLIIIGLIGTTVVPYNLFLHANSVSKKWKKATDLKFVRWDTALSILLGGIVSMAIVVTSGVAMQSVNEVGNAQDLAIQLEPLLGSWAKYFMAGGLFAAGITSSITAPLAAAFATVGIMGKSDKLKSPVMRRIMIGIILIGVVFSSVGLKPVQVIQFAQIANGLLLPVIGIFLVWIMNRKALLGKYTNSTLQNILGIIIIGITVVLGFKSIGSVFNLF